MNTSFLKDICDSITDCPHSTPVWTKEGKLVVRTFNIKNGRLDLSNPSYTDQIHFEERIRRNKPLSGDLIITREAPMGEVCVIPKNVECCLGQRVVLLKPNLQKANSNYLRYSIMTNFVQSQIALSGGTGTTVSNLRIPLLEKLEIPLPPLPEQQKIADILTTVDDHISETEALIEKTKALKQGLMQQLLTKGIGHTEFKDTEIGRIPVEWKVVKVEDAYEILDSKRIPINESERNKRIGDVPYYGANGIVGFIDDYIFDEPLILLAEDGGNFEDFKNRPIAYLIEGKSWVNNHAHVLKPMTTFEFKWLFYVMQHKDVTAFIKGGTRSKLNQKDLRNILVPIPPRFEQSFISQTLTSVDDQIDTYQAKLASLTRLKTGLMQQLLTGKIRVKV